MRREARRGAVMRDLSRDSDLELELEHELELESDWSSVIGHEQYVPVVKVLG